jgi:hypothetical protein
MIEFNCISLPNLMELNHYGGDYNSYEDALLEVYKVDLWNSGLTFNNLNVIPRVRKKFEINGKVLDWTFAHFTSKGDVDDDRELDLRRCERICWVKPIIENAHLECIKVWENQRADNKGNLFTSVVIWYEEANSKIVLTPRTGEKGDHYVVTTFYLINQPHKVKKINDEYKEYVKKNGEYKVVAP